MDSLIISLNAVLPMFIMMAVGYFLKKIHFFAENTPNELNKLVFRLLMAPLLFKSAYQADLSQVVNVPFLLTNAGLSLGTYLIMALCVSHYVPDVKKRGSLLQGMFRGNLALIGLVVAESLFGAENTGLMAVSAAVIVPIYNVLAVLTLSKCGGEKTDALGVFKKIVTNPMILGCFSGVAVNLMGVTLPKAIVSVISSFGGAASPVALVALGATFRFDKVGENKKYITVGVLTKLVLLPMVCLGVGIALGYRDVELGTMAVIHSAPVAATSFAMAQQMGCDGDLAASLVVFSGALSCFTIFLWLFSLLQLQLI